MAITIVPAILVTTRAEWQERLQQVQGIFERVQIDVIDGQYAENETLDFPLMTGVEELQLDMHLMVKEPIFWVEKCRRLGAKWVTGQVEQMSDQHKFAELVKMGNMEVGLALDLETSIKSLESGVLSLVDHILLMSVKAGFSGQLFASQVLAKIKETRRLVSPKVEIGVDGGINETNITQIAQAGADVAYIGSALWKATDIKKKLEQLEKAAKLT